MLKMRLLASPATVQRDLKISGVIVPERGEWAVDEGWQIIIGLIVAPIFLVVVAALGTDWIKLGKPASVVCAEQKEMTPFCEDLARQYWRKKAD